jgi:hypothetical protein
MREGSKTVEKGSGECGHFPHRACGLSISGNRVRMRSARIARRAKAKWLLRFLEITYLTCIVPVCWSDEAYTKVAVRTR